MSLSTAAEAYSAVRIAGCISLPLPKYGDTIRRSPSLLVVVTSALYDSNEVAGTSTSSEDDVQKDSIKALDIVPFLISTLNVERALRGIKCSRVAAITEVNHYARLDLLRRCLYDQVGPAYNAKVTKLNGEGLDEDELLLKESYTILSSVEERRLYDWSLAGSANHDRYVWPFEPDITQMPTQPPPPPELEDVGLIRLVRYGFLAWVLSIALNR